MNVCLNSWTTSGLKSQGRLSVGSNRDREISMSVGLGRSKLDSKGGVVGGNIDVNTLEMVCKYTFIYLFIFKRKKLLPLNLIIFFMNAYFL